MGINTSLVLKLHCATYATFFSKILWRVFLSFLFVVVVVLRM